RAAGAAQPGISRQVPAPGDRALGQADPRGRHQRGLRAMYGGGTGGTMRSFIVVTVLVLLGCAGPASAQEWPSRPLTMVVPFAAGGPIDVAGRILAQPMAELLGQQIVIENIGGGGGMTGSSRVAKAAPDGYVFLYGNAGTHTFSQLLYKKPLYDAVTDFAPVAVMLENSKV